WFQTAVRSVDIAVKAWIRCRSTLRGSGSVAPFLALDSTPVVHDQRFRGSIQVRAHGGFAQTCRSFRQKPHEHFLKDVVGEVQSAAAFRDVAAQRRSGLLIEATECSL